MGQGVGISFYLEAEGVRSAHNHVFTGCKSLWYPVCVLHAGKRFEEYADLINLGL